MPRIRQNKCWICKLCDKTIIGRDSMLEHIKNEHKKTKKPSRYYSESSLVIL